MTIRFEEISNNAWPALQVIQYDGWLLRFANGVTKRSNSISMLYPSSLNPEDKISFCERIFAEKGITPCFKVTPASQPGNIDEILASRGYFIHSHISFQTIDLTELPILEGGEISLKTELTPGWIDEFIRMNGFDPDRRSTYTAIMEQLCLPKCLVSVIRNNRIVGVGLGVAEAGFIGLFDIVVDREFRGTGLGRLIVANILRRGKEMGAQQAYLQVLTDNQPAIRLYEKTGFRELYRYWYRMKP